jgi:hypothetical protein
MGTNGEGTMSDDDGTGAEVSDDDGTGAEVSAECL